MICVDLPYLLISQLDANCSVNTWLITWSQCKTSMMLLNEGQQLAFADVRILIILAEENFNDTFLYMYVSLSEVTFCDIIIIFTFIASMYIII